MGSASRPPRVAGYLDTLGGIGPHMIRTIAVFAYGAGCILAAYLVLAGLAALNTAWSNGGKVGLLEAFASSFLPMLTLMVMSLLAQRRSKVILLPLIVIIPAAAITLFFALATHWAPGIGDPLGLKHIAIVVVAVSWSARILRRSGTK